MLYALLLSCCYHGNAQNLIPNPSFELQNACPTAIDGFYFPSQGERYVKYWYWPSVGTSDYYSSCASDSIISVPYSLFGYQYARTGESYAGGLVENMGNEYVESPLSSALIAGHRYFVSYWLNVANNSWGGANLFGAYFSQNAVEMPNALVLDMLTPQVESPPGLIFADTVGWAEVSGVYTAAGNEQWLTIGNFHHLSNLDTVAFREETGFGSGPMYYFYEDVCVLDMDGLPMHFAVSDTTLCGGTSLVLNATPGLGNYLWNDGTAGVSKEITTSGTYWVKSVDVESCMLHTDTFKVSGMGDIVPLNIGKDTAICVNQTITLNAEKASFENYHWSTGANTSSIDVSTPGLYIVTASSDCVTGIDSINITVSENCNCLFVPNAFSPNNDGLNDHLKAEVSCPFAFFQFKIFNRFGEQVFITNNPATAWNGYHKGAACDGGAYFYSLRYIGQGSPDSKAIDLKGDITLLR